MNLPLYKRLDHILSNWKGKVCVFGAGKMGTGEVYDLLRMTGIKIDCYIDNNVTPGTLVRENISVKSPVYLKENQCNYYVIACFGQYLRPQIEKQLSEYNVDNYCFICWEDLNSFFDELDLAPEYVKRRYSEIYDDELFILKQYREMTGMALDLHHPHTFNEKMQWIKINYRDPATINYVDKYKAKDLVASKIGNDYIIPTIGVWDRFGDILFDSLPEKFVLKCTHDSGSVAICHDRSMFDISRVQEKFERALKKNYFWHAREWQYRFITPRIIAEEYIGEDDEDIMDYKIFCFNGVPRIIQVDYDRFGNHRRNLYTTEWEYIDAAIKYPTEKEHIINKPDNLDEMLRIAECLSEGFIHVRVDLYDHNGRIYFGEMTFCHGAGYEHFSSKDLAIKMGDYIRIPTDEFRQKERKYE